MGSAQAVDVTIEYPHNKWVQKSSPISGATVEDLLTLEVTSQKGTWAVFTFDHENGAYVQMRAGQELLAGEGFWAIQTTGKVVVASLSGNSRLRGSSIVASNPGDASVYAKLGNPFPYDMNVSEIYFLVGEATLSFPEAAGVYHDGSIDAYIDGAYVSLTAGDTLPVAQGFWIQLLGNEQITVQFGYNFGPPPPPTFSEAYFAALFAE